MKKLLLILATSLALMGCSTNSDSGYSSQDIMFAEMMIPHHLGKLDDLRAVARI